VLEIAFRPDRSSEVPLGRQLADHLAALIEAGRIPPGGKLPATREVASAVGVGRKTATAAYEILSVRGLVAAHVGQGTFVTARPAAPRRLLAVDAASGARPPRAFAWPGLFARGSARRWAGMWRHADPVGTYPFDFRGGRIDASALPVQELRWAFARAFQTRSRLQAIAGHLEPFGWPPLRREIARQLASRGIACDAADVAVVSGVQQAISLTARVLVEPGDAVAMEQPGYFGAALAFAGVGADLLGIEVDGQGLDTERLARVLRVRRAKLVYVTPATQSPTGAAMSPERRDALLELADEYQVPIFEDDYDCELRYAGPILPALKATDPAGHVIHAGTFSKVLFPSLRLGYVVAAQPLLERLVMLRAVADFGSGVVEQAALASLLATRGLERHVRRIRKHYGERLDAVLGALAKEMPEEVAWTRPQSGHVVWLTLPPKTDPDRMQQAALDGGVAYTRGEAFHFDGRGGDRVLLSFAASAPAVIAEGVARLAAVIREQIAARRPTQARAGKRPLRSETARRRGPARAGKRSRDAAE
jgi:GntR family transcriptional regulator / MocR family aminotransferase